MKLVLKFIPVYCDRRALKDGDVQFWTDFWLKESQPVHIVAAVAASQIAIPKLFPCLEHRFVLVDRVDSERKGMESDDRAQGPGTR